MKVAVIGLDGMYWDLLNKLCDNGFMPFLHSRLQRGVKAPLQSTIPPYTPPAWTSISSGVQPDIHGIFGFLHVTPSLEGFKVRLATSLDVCFPRLWEVLSLLGMKSIVINAPLTHPFLPKLFKDRCTMFSGWDSPRAETYPADLKERFQCLVSYPHEWWNTTKYADTSLYIQSLTKLAEEKADAIAELSELHDWNLFFIIFSEPDWVMHRLLEVHTGQLAQVGKLFRAIDKAIGYIASQVDATIICSDHGFKLYRGIFYGNKILANAKLVSYSLTKAPSARGAVQEASISKSRAKIALFKTAKTVLDHFPRLKRFLKTAPITKQFVHHFVIDYSSSKAFMTEMWLLYSLEGCSEKVLELFKSFSHVVDIISLSSLYKTWREHFPRFLIVPRRDVWPSSVSLRGGGVFDESVVVPNHAMHGVFLAFGDNIAKGELAEVKCIDVTPTVLAYLNLPLPRGVQGSVVKDIAHDTGLRRDYHAKWNILRKLSRGLQT